MDVYAVMENNNNYIENLFINYQSDLIGYLQKKFNCPFDFAEDLAQDAYMRMQGMKDVSLIRSHKAHLYKTASNLAIDFFRREKLQNKYLEEQGAMHFDEACAETPDGFFELEQQFFRFDASVKKLPGKCRKALIAHRVNGVEYKDIATNLSVSVSSVEKYIYRATEQCRKVLF